MDNGNIESANKRLALFISIVLIGAIAVIVYSALTGNTNQKFTDLVIEYTAMDGSNKSAERTMFYLFSIIGAVTYGIAFLKSKWGYHCDTTQDISGINIITVGLLVSGIVNLVIYKNINWIAFFALVFVLISYKKDKSQTVLGTSFFFMVIYALCGAYRGVVFLGVHIALNNVCVAVGALLVSLVVLFFAGGKQLFIKGILIAQLFIPLTLLVYLASNYKYNDAIMNIHIPSRIQLIIFAIILGFFFEACFIIKRSWNKGQELDDVLSYGACVSIMAFNRFSGSGAIVSSDLHHPFENIIGYSQMFELGQKAFSEYIPVSGLYSIVQGLFFKIFGHGFAGFYALSANMFYLAIIFIIVFLLRKQLGAQWVLVISLVFLVTDYNRVTLIIPIILLLVWPALIEKKNLWLKGWFLTSFVHALYYPVFGAAVCIGFAPLGIWQIFTYAKSGDLLKDIKTVKFWVWWLICFIPVILGSGLLLGTIKHMLAMGSQTIYADGKARFGQEIAPNFLPYISNLSIRLVVYLLFTYLIMISIIWISVALFLRSGNARFEKFKFMISNHEAAFLAISISLIMLVSFSYTVVRFDYNDIYSRSDGVVRAVFVLLVILIARYLHNNKNVLWIFTFTIFIMSAVSGEGFLKINVDEKLAPVYTVPEGYVYVANNDLRLGECFLEEDTYNYISHTNDYLNTLDRDASYLGIVDSFGLYYLCDIKGDAAMEILNTIKGYGAVEETVDNIRRNNTIVGMNISPVRNYYFYHWLVTSGDYIFDNDLRLFIPNDGSVAKEDILEQNKDINLNLSTEADDVGDVAGSFGTSLESLKPVFTEKNYKYSVENNEGSVKLDFDDDFDGDEADFMYIEFEGLSNNYDYALYDCHDPVFIEEKSKIAKALMKKIYNNGTEVIVTWVDEDGEVFSMSANMDEGKLLMPLGAARGWLLNNHSFVTITVKHNDEIIQMPKIKDIKMLKLREVE